MRNRNVLKQAENGRKLINETRDLTLNELYQLYDMTETSFFNAFTAAFYMGVSVGIRQEKDRNKQKKIQ